MSTPFNIGAQVVQFDFKEEAKASEFNALLHEIIEPGIFTVGGITIDVSSNSLLIEPFHCMLRSDGEKTTHIKTTENVLFSASGGWPVNETIHVYCLFDWLDVIENWMSFNARLASSGTVNREIILCTVTTDGAGIIQTVTTGQRTTGLNKSYVQSLLDTQLGLITSLTTTDKSNTVNAINELVTIVNPLASKNELINSDFQVDQENEGVITGVSDGQYMADMWQVNKSGSFSIDYARLLDQDINSVSSNLLELTVTSPVTLTASDYLSISTFVEGSSYKIIHGAKVLNLSFWVKHSLAGTYAIVLQNADATRSYITEYTIAGGEINTLVRKTLQIVSDNSGTWLFDEQVGLRLRFILGSGTDYQSATLDAWQTTTTPNGLIASASQTQWIANNTETFSVGRVNLFFGSLDRPHLTKSYREELADCQRFKIILVNDGSAVDVPILDSYETQAALTKFRLQLNQKMRIIPTTSLVGVRDTDWSMKERDANANSTGSAATSSLSKEVIGIEFSSGTYIAKEQHTIFLKTTLGKVKITAEY